MKTILIPLLNSGVHIMGWALLGFLQLFYVPLSWNVDIPTFFWVWKFIVLAMMIFLFYTNTTIIVPRTIIKGKNGLFVLWIVCVVLVTQIVTYFYTTSTNMHEYMTTLLNNNRKNSLLDNVVLTITIIMLGISTSYALLKHWRDTERYKKELEQDKILVELNMLKMQINPHFFFNSLNSIHSLTYLNIDNSREALLTLGKMMRYLLYNVESHYSSLCNEIDFLKNYITIMSLRASKKVMINVDIQEDIQDFPIAPMILLPFVENAFKHGVEPTKGAEIIITLAQDGSRLKMDVINTINGDSDQHTDEGGIGLNNTKRRLELLYPEAYHLVAGVNNICKYEVNLQIDLDRR